MNIVPALGKHGKPGVRSALGHQLGMCFVHHKAVFAVNEQSRACRGQPICPPFAVAMLLRDAHARQIRAKSEAVLVLQHAFRKIIHGAHANLPQRLFQFFEGSGALRE